MNTIQSSPTSLPPTAAEVMSTAIEIVQEPATITRLLPYIPGTWANLHLPVAIGPVVYFNDLVKMRSSLGIPTSITGESTRKDKLKLITGLKKHFPFTPEKIDIVAAGAFSEWGWDIADVDGTLYFSDYEVAVIVGHFSRPEIADKLINKGYSPQKSGEFSLFVSPESEYKFALKKDTLIVGKTFEGNNGVEQLLKNVSQNVPGIDQSPVMGEILPLITDSDGAVLMPSADVAAYMKNFHQNTAKLPPDVLQGIETLVPANYKVSPLTWDFSVIAVQAKKPTKVTLIYHFPSANEANNNKGLLKSTFEKTKSMYIQNKLWSELLPLDSVEIQDDLLVGHAHTDSDNLIASAFDHEDAYVFLLMQDY